MSGTVENKLAELGVTLPAPAAAAANYVPYVISGNMVFVSGQITMLDGELQYLGTVGDDLTLDDGIAAARICAINLIAQVKEACGGDLDRVKRVVKLGGFVNSPAEFSDHPKIINGASDLMVEIFGESIGQHARFAVGAPALPLGVAVEVDAVIEMA